VPSVLDGCFFQQRATAGQPVIFSLFDKGRPMKNVVWLTLAGAIVLGASAEQAEARGGGRGGVGGRPGGNISAGRSGSYLGNRSAGDRSVGDRQSGNRDAADRALSTSATGSSGKLANKTSQLKTSYTGKSQPFSPAWYADHPRAWQAVNPHADAWAVASLGAAGAWLGVNALTNDTVYTAETESDDATDDSLTQEGETDLPADDAFLPLGVFAIAPRQETDANAILQLAVNRDGIVRGTYVDLLTNQEQSIEGAVDKKTQRVAWRVGDNGSVTFETRLSSLTQSAGPLTLNFGNGKTRDWTLARFDSDKQGAR
jgi:hypothetical protein